QPDLPVIVLAAPDQLDGAIHAVKQGAADWVALPFFLPELDVRLDRAVEHTRLVRRGRQLEEQLQGRENEPSSVEAGRRHSPPGEESQYWREVEKRHVQEVWRQTNNNKVQTARILGISRRALYRLLEKFHLPQRERHHQNNGNDR